MQILIDEFDEDDFAILPAILGLIVRKTDVTVTTYTGERQVLRRPIKIEQGRHARDLALADSLNVIYCRDMATLEAYATAKSAI